MFKKKLLLTIISIAVCLSVTAGLILHIYSDNDSVAVIARPGVDSENVHIDDWDSSRPFVTPVVLLHGRAQNSEKDYGLITSIPQGFNRHYGTDESLPVNDGSHKPYADVSSQTILYIVPGSGERTPENLGHYLVYSAKDHYVVNKNLFVFNYPNRDMVKPNAEKLREFLFNLAKEMANDEENAKYFFRTISDRDAARTAKNMAEIEFEVNLIGHSNGGLVARYFIENLDGSEVVNKLIAINTPHWGSELAVASNIVLRTPMDYDLNPTSQLFGGNAITDDRLLFPNKDFAQYVIKNQSPKLSGNRGKTKYYFIASYDLPMWKIIRDASIHRAINKQPLYFDLTLGVINTFGDYTNSVRNSFASKEEYFDIANNPTFNSVVFENLHFRAGDNIVELTSQLGLNFASNAKPESTKLAQVDADKYFLTMDTFWGNNPLPGSHYHGQNQHRRETVEKVEEYLQD